MLSGRDSNGKPTSLRLNDDGSILIGVGSASAAVTPVTAQGVAKLLVKNSPGNFIGGKMTAGATAGFFIAYNSASVPADSSTLVATNILDVIPVAANQTVALGDYVTPDQASIGIALVFSTSLTTMTVPANLAVFIRGKAV